jgi:hypothetical protein
MHDAHLSSRIKGRRGALGTSLSSHHGSFDRSRVIDTAFEQANRFPQSMHAGIFLFGQTANQLPR